MSDDRDVELLLVDTVERLFARHSRPDMVRAVPPGGWSAELWQTVSSADLPVLGVAEEDGGAGGSRRHAALALRAAGRHAAPIPLAETLVANWLVTAAGHEVKRGPMSVGWASRGRSSVDAHAVPFARHAEAITLIDAGAGRVQIGVAATHGCRLRHGVDFADSPADDVHVPAASIDWRPLDASQSELPDALIGLVRTAQIAGALDAIVTKTIRHVRERNQFGRPLAQLPQVRERIALLHEEASVAAAAMDAASDALSGDGSLRLAQAVAVRAANAAGVGARLTHQLHGAIGTTAEHELQLLTRRLWTWRQLRGGERAWARRVGRGLASTGRDDLWALLTAECFEERRYG